jgi:hypothetical protein
MFALLLVEVLLLVVALMNDLSLRTRRCDGVG